MPLDHSLESQKSYESRAQFRTYMPEDLQITSYRGLARKAVRPFAKVFERYRSKDTIESQNHPKIDPLEASLTHVSKRPVNLQEPLYQSQSTLFKLPIELRQEIYVLVLGRSNVHIKGIRGNKVLRHTRCNCLSCPGTAYSHERGGAWKKEWRCTSGKYDLEGDRLSPQLLFTCRAVYTEAIDFLYSSNTFSFRSRLIMQRWLEEMLPQRSSHLRKIHIDLSLAISDPIFNNMVQQPITEERPDTDNPKFWADSWSQVIHLPDLRELQVRVHPTAGYFRVTNKSTLSPLQQMCSMDPNRQIDSPKVTLYIPENFVQEDWMRQAPFTLFTPWEWPWIKEANDTSRNPVTVFETSFTRDMFAH